MAGGATVWVAAAVSAVLNVTCSADCKFSCCNMSLKPKLHNFDLLWICCTTCCTTNPQQIEVVEFGLSFPAVAMLLRSF